MILKEWNNLKKIREFLLEKNFIETPSNCNNSKLNILQSVYFRSGIAKHAMILGIIQLHPEDPNPSKIFELYKKEYKSQLSENNRINLRADLIPYLILITSDGKKIMFVDLKGRGKTKSLTKDMSIEDLIFEKKLAKLKFNPSKKDYEIYNKSFESLFEKNDYNIFREEIIKDLVEEKDKISIDSLQKMLNFQDSNKFHIQVLEWAKKFSLIIDGDYLIINKDDLGFFVEELDRKYEEWTKLKPKK